MTSEASNGTATLEEVSLTICQLSVVDSKKVPTWTLGCPKSGMWALASRSSPRDLQTASYLLRSVEVRDFPKK